MIKRLTSLKLKLLIVLIPGTILAFSLALAITLFQAEQQFSSHFDEKKKHLGNYADLIAEPVWNFNTESIESIITTIMLDSDIAFVKVHDEGNNLVASKSRVQDTSTNLTYLTFPIIYSNAHITQRAGELQIAMGNTSLLKEKQQFIITAIVSLFLIILTIVTGLWLTFSKLLEQPIQTLIEAIKNNHGNDSFIHVDHQSNDELGQISSAFNEMQSRLASNHKKITDSKEHLQRLYHSTPSLLFSFNQQGIIQDASNYFIEQLDYKKEDIIGQPLQTLLYSEDKTGLIENVTQRLWHELQLDSFPLTIKDGKDHPVEVLLDATLSARQSFPDALAVMTDITSLNQVTKELQRQANTDHLSGVANRFSFQTHLEKLISKRKKSGIPFALLFIDLDHFKSVNDTFGHHTGDQLLCQVTERIKSSIRPCDRIARLGGDEFAVILEELPTEDSAEQIAKRIIHHLQPGFSLADSNIFISASIGIAIYPKDCDTPTKLLQFADLAMYRAKEEGRSCLAFYSDEDIQIIQERLKIEKLLHNAIEEKRLEIHYQPIICLNSKRIAGVEALIRLRDEKNNLISPAEFIMIAEETGLIVTIGEWCIRESTRQLAQWKQDIDPELYLSVNVSTRQFQSKSFYNSLASAIRDAKLNAEDILIEITESLLLHDNQNNLTLFKNLKDLGCKIAIDDFGTGYSALSYLMKFPLSVLKIDRSFINQYSESNTKLGLVTAIIQMGQSMNLKIIAEGIETEDQLQMLKRLSSEVSVQGFLLSKPLSSEQFSQRYDAITEKVSTLTSVDSNSNRALPIRAS